MKEKILRILKTNINYKYFYHKYNKKNILILHWWWWSSDSWVTIWQMLFDRWFNVIIPDLPWFWKTILDSTYTLEKYATLIETFTKKLNLDKLILWWHSNGWAISIMLENRWKIDLIKLILNNSAWIRDEKNRNSKRKLLNNFTKIVKEIPILWNKDNSFIKKLREIFYKIIWWQDYLKAEKNKHLKQTYLNMISSDLKKQIKNIKTETLLIWWENDTYTPLADWKKMEKLIKNSELIEIKNEQHSIHINNPEKLFLAFINNI